MGRQAVLQSNAYGYRKFFIISFKQQSTDSFPQNTTGVTYKRKGEYTEAIILETWLLCRNLRWVLALLTPLPCSSRELTHCCHTGSHITECRHAKFSLSRAFYCAHKPRQAARELMGLMFASTQYLEAFERRLPLIFKGTNATVFDVLTNPSAIVN